MKKAALVLGYLVGGYLVVRAILEPFVIDVGDPSTYEDDWGGPSLLGVLAVHCAPGAIAFGLMVWDIKRRRRAAG